PSNTRNQPLETGIGVAQAGSLGPAWSFKIGDHGGAGGMTGTPIVADGCVYVGSGDGSVFAVNADTGELVWRAQAQGAVNASLAVADGRVFGLVSRSGSPGAFALNQADGAALWTAVLDEQPGSDAYASPVVHDGLVFAGFSGAAAETSVDEAERLAFQGGYVLLEVATGEVAHKQYTIHPPGQPDDDLAGGAVWSTPAVDTETGFAYVGTGNPFNPRKQDPRTDAIVKVDLRRGSASFGEIVAHYTGTVDEYFTELSNSPCVDLPGNPPPWYPQGAGSCFDVDLDFGASPNLFTVDGRKLVGDGQKSGVYHAADADSMEGVWKALLGPPSLAGGIVGSAALAGSSIVGPVTPAGYMWSVGQADGSLGWLAPTADAAHYAHQATVANGVLYTTDTKGFVDAYDAATGGPLLHLPVDPTAGSLGAGVAVARHTVYAEVGNSLVALRLPA
ncbi:MAG TPA: PQQ-binding-like beta-propeller repeat protein, partial [Acidimicrobiales bacterium]|nr:PQQ-binding-like beta-propeller repeat protein [Acidimicrobiales bacterium]